MTVRLVQRETPLTEQQITAQKDLEDKLRSASDDTLASELVDYVNRSDGSTLPVRVLVEVLIDWSKSLPDSDLRQFWPLLDPKNSIFASTKSGVDKTVGKVVEQFLLELGGIEARNASVIEALWGFLRGSALIEPVDSAFSLILRLQDDMPAIFDKLVEDTAIFDWQRGSLLVYHRRMRDILEQRWQAWHTTNQPMPNYIPLVVAALKYTPHPGVVDVVLKWLVNLPQSLHFPDEIRLDLLKTFANHLSNVRFLSDSDYLQPIRERNLFTKAIRLSGDTFFDTLVKEYHSAPWRVVELYLQYSPENLEQIWSKGDDRRRQVLDLMQRLLEASESPAELRLQATKWLAEHVSAIGWNEGAKLRPVLLQLIEDSEPDSNVKAYAKQMLGIMEDLDAEPTTLLTRAEEAADANADEAARLIRRLAERGDSPALRVLFVGWVSWIMSGRQPDLVEIASEAMLWKKSAVQPLIEQLVFDSRSPTRPADSPTAQKYHDGRLAVRQRASKQLADMSDRKLAPKTERDFSFDDIRTEMVDSIAKLARCLLNETDPGVCENLARILGNIGDPQAVDTLAQAIVGYERERVRRKDLLRTYYLDPAKQSSDDARGILNEAVKKGKDTLFLLQVMNLGVFLVGLLIILVGLYTALNGEGAQPDRWFALLTSLGGFAGLIFYFIRNPLDRIQNAMTALVQTVTAFVSFIWNLNLNTAYIQSQYVDKGILTNDEIANAVERIEGGMNLTLGMLATYTMEGQQKIAARLTGIWPAAAELGSAVEVYGEHLQGDGSRMTKSKNPTATDHAPKGLIAINHLPISASDPKWRENVVQFNLPGTLDGLQGENGIVWISLVIDGIETNALPFGVIKKVENDNQVLATSQ